MCVKVASVCGTLTSVAGVGPNFSLFIFFFCGMAGPPHPLEGSHTRDDISGLGLNYLDSTDMAVENETIIIIIIILSPPGLTAISFTKI